MQITQMFAEKAFTQMGKRKSEVICVISVK